MNNKKELNPAINVPKWLRSLFAFLEFISPILTSRIATLFFFTPIRFNTPKLEFEISNKSLSKTIKFKNNRIKIYEWGNSKKAVLLVHGWSGRATQVAHLNEPLIEAGYKVYSFDAPAHGNSNGRHTHMLEFADLIFEIKKIHPEIESVIGHSIGGAACIYALTQGLNAKKCIIIGSPVSTHWVLNSFCKQINVSIKVENLMKNHLEYKFQKQFDDISIDSMVKKINTKGMIIHCENDLDAPVKHAKYIHKNWKNSTLVLTQNLGHRKILKNKEVSESIIDFLKT